MSPKINKHTAIDKMSLESTLVSIEHASTYKSPTPHGKNQSSHVVLILGSASKGYSKSEDGPVVLASYDRPAEQRKK